MICRRCGSDNPDNAAFCSNCGNCLTRRPVAARRFPPWYAVLAGALGLLAAGFFISRALSRAPANRATRSAAAGTASPVALRAAPGGPSEKPAPMSFVVIETPFGREKSRRPAAVLDGDWVALPAWALLGGGKLVLEQEGAEPVPIEWGIWAGMDPVVLCRLERQPSGGTLCLSAWRPDVRLQWKSLSPQGNVFDVGSIAPGMDGSFLSFTLPGEIREAGILTQDEVVVGWTFGPAGERGYLWLGKVSVDRAPRTRLSEISGTILSASREARFDAALELGDSVPPALRLKALGEAFRAEPAFDENDVPAALRPEAIVARMHASASELIRDGSAADAARILDDELLAETGSTALVEDAVLAQAAMRGRESAILELERLGKKSTIARNLDPAELSRFKAQLYKEWLREIIAGRRSGGADAFEKAELALPDDAEIHLLGVEIAIMERNWPRAAELLEMRSYPEPLAARARMFTGLIQQGQSADETAVLRFDPGTDHIPVEAVVNGKVRQKFIIDTGATMSSIPSSLLEALGIRIDDNTKVIVVSGIAGAGLTHEVKLGSIELAGLRVDNVQAFVADIPSYEETGILGQNVLNKFQVDIDYQKGILRIRKR